MKRIARFSFITAWLLSLLTIFCSNRGLAQADPLVPQLLEVESFYQQTAPTQGASPQEPEWVAGNRSLVDNLKEILPAGQQDNAKRHEMENPPMRRNWWNYPLYAAFGLPLDLVDGFFGVLSIIPPVNLLTTGLFYELIPSQALIRHPNDRHRLPFTGKVNENGHGWHDGRWGYFSHYRNTGFMDIDTNKLEDWKSENQQLDHALSQNAKKEAEQNAEIARLRAQYLRETRQLFGDEKHTVVVQRLIPYLEIDPGNNDARAMLAASLIASLPQISEREWADRKLMDIIWGSSRSILLPLREEISDAKGALAQSDDAKRYLIAINMRLGNYGQALRAAEDLVAANPSNVSFLRLRYEAALANGNPNQMEPAILALEKAMGEDAEAVRHARGRQAIALGEPQKAIVLYQALIRSHPSNSRYHYLLAMAHLEHGQKTGNAGNRRAALRELNKAIKTAVNPEEKEFYRYVASAAKEARAKNR